MLKSSNFVVPQASPANNLSPVCWLPWTAQDLATPNNLWEIERVIRRHFRGCSCFGSHLFERRESLCLARPTLAKERQINRDALLILRDGNPYFENGCACFMPCLQLILIKKKNKIGDPPAQTMKCWSFDIQFLSRHRFIYFNPSSHPLITHTRFKGVKK